MSYCKSYLPAHWKSCSTCPKSWFISLLLTFLLAQHCSAQNIASAKQKAPILKKTTNIFNHDVTSSVCYYDTLGNIVLHCFGEYIYYNKYPKGEDQYGIFVFRNQLSLGKTVQSDSSLKSFKNEFNTNKIAAFKTCFQKLYGDSLLNYLNGIDFGKLFKEEELKLYKYFRYHHDTTEKVTLSDGDTIEWVWQYPRKNHCEIEISKDKNGIQKSVYYTIYDDSGNVTDQIFIQGEKDTSYHHRHSYQNNLWQESYFVHMGKEKIYEKRFYEKGKLVKLEEYDNLRLLREQSYHYDEQGRLEKIVYYGNNTISYYEYY